jgi:hypothetical protein
MRNSYSLKSARLKHDQHGISTATSQNDGQMGHSRDIMHLAI